MSAAHILELLASGQVHAVPPEMLSPTSLKIPELPPTCLRFTGVWQGIVLGFYGQSGTLLHLPLLCLLFLQCECLNTCDSATVV